MIAKIMRPSKDWNAIRYNEDKRNKGTAELVGVLNMGAFAEMNLLSTDMLQRYFQAYSSVNTKVDKAQFHVVFSCKGHSKTKEELVEFAKQWLEKMGYGNNPALIYFHHDTDNSHLHVVTSRIGADGKKIDDHHERRRSQRVIDEILNVSRKEELDKAINNAFSYSFQSIGQFKSVLECCGYETYEEEGYLKMKKGGVVILTMPSDDIKAQFRQDDEDERKKRAAQIRALIIKYKEMCYTKEELSKLMKDKFGIQIVFHGKENRPYGYTVVDHKSKTVFKGSSVMPLKDLLEFITYTKEDINNELLAYILDLMKKDNMITTREINSKLKEISSAYIHKGYIAKGEEKVRLGKMLEDKLKYNDKVVWVQSFNPRTEEEMAVLARIYKVKEEHLHISEITSDIDDTLRDNLVNLILSSRASTIGDNLEQADMRLFNCNNHYYVISNKYHIIISFRELGIDGHIMDKDAPKGEGRGESVSQAGTAETQETGHDTGKARTDTLMDKAIRKILTAFSVGRGTSHGTGGAGVTELARSGRKRKKKDSDEDNDWGLGY